MTQTHSKRVKFLTRAYRVVQSHPGAWFKMPRQSGPELEIVSVLLPQPIEEALFADLAGGAGKGGLHEYLYWVDEALRKVEATFGPSKNCSSANGMKKGPRHQTLDRIRT